MYSLNLSAFLIWLKNSGYNATSLYIFNPEKITKEKPLLWQNFKINNFSTAWECTRSCKLGQLFHAAVVSHCCSFGRISGVREKPVFHLERAWEALSEGKNSLRKCWTSALWKGNMLDLLGQQTVTLGTQSALPTHLHPVHSPTQALCPVRWAPASPAQHIWPARLLGPMSARPRPFQGQLLTLKVTFGYLFSLSPWTDHEGGLAASHEPAGDATEAWPRAGQQPAQRPLRSHLRHR